jgi:hypothetical protein
MVLHVNQSYHIMGCSRPACRAVSIVWKLSVATAFQWLLGLTLFPLVPLYAWRSIKMAIQSAEIEAAINRALPEWSIL